MTARVTYIVDGYNMLHRIPELRRQAGSGLEAGRKALLVRLAAFRARSRNPVVVVFDGNPEVSGGSGAAGGIEVVFSRKPVNADTAIKQLIDRRKNEAALAVVSSDHEIMWYARACGCEVLSSEAFFSRLKTASATATDDAMEDKSDPQMSRGELDDWKKLFGIE
jgi:predicted RNA-binding protein with PIN domain